VRYDGRDERVTVAEAASRLGTTKEAVRKRISRGTLRSDKDPDGAVRVYVPPSPTASGTGNAQAGVDASRDTALVEEMRSRIGDLKEQLEAERRANEENRRIIAALTSRIPELEPAREQEPPQEPPEAPQTATEQPGRVEPQASVEGAQEGSERPERSWRERVRGLRRRFVG
jgi:hypothetical protein